MTVSNLSLAFNILSAIIFILYLLGEFRPPQPEKVNFACDCGQCPTPKPQEAPPELAEITALDGKSFASVGSAPPAESDKVTEHQYQFAYQKYLSMIRNQPLSLAEIGLGCGMPYGPGHSYFLWRKYIPKAKIVFFEYKKDCAEEWKATITDPDLFIMTGDQSNVANLQQLYSTLGPFDVMIDDGGHTMNQQITSLTTLLPLLKSGGIYFLEDLHTSYYPEYGGRNDGNTTGTTIGLVQNLVAELTRADSPGQTPGPLSDLANLIRSIDCFRRICVFRKK